MIRQRVIMAVRDELGVPVTFDSAQGLTEGWDSVAQVGIVLACEQRFGVRFEVKDIQTAK